MRARAFAWAAELVLFDLETLDARLDAEAAESDATAVAGRVAVSEGDVERALGEAEHVFSGAWSQPFTPALPLEPPLALTWLDEDRRLVVRSSAESPFRVRGTLAERLGIPAAQIRVVRPAVAGGALGRSELLVEDVCAPVTLRTGRPAQLALGPAEALAIAPGRPAQRVRLRLGVTRGELVGLDFDLLVDMGALGEAATELLRASARHAVKLMESDPAPGLVYCGSLKVNGRGEVLEEMKPTKRGDIFEDLLHRNYLLGPASVALFSRDVLRKSGLFDPALSPCADWDLWIRMARCVLVDFVDQPLVHYVLHEGNMHGNISGIEKDTFALLNKYWPGLAEETGCVELKNKVYSDHAIHFAWQYLRAG